MNGEEIDKIYNFPYKLDTFQEKSIRAILNQEHVLVTAHTSAGKSTIAEFSIAYSNSIGKRSIYTSPIKALSNQKYGDFQKKFKDTSVGIMTGDIKVNPDADVLVATTEIVNNLLYTNIEYFDDVFCIVLDEVHYIRDRDRGKVWESVIAMMPKHVVLVMLSASIPGAEGFADWVRDIKEKPCQLISTLYRPVPLVHKVYWDGEMEDIISENSTKFNFPKYKRIYDLWKTNDYKKKIEKKSTPTLLINFLNMLQEKELFPALFFDFSRKVCEKYAMMIQRSWLSGKEQTECINIYDTYIKRYLGEKGMQLTQVWMIRDFLKKGVCVHHSGLIPIIKEIIETIFDKGYIKVMFVTETFSVGINMPTKAVIFGSLQKFDGIGQRNLIPEEYCQMSGRAGRRGKDTLGVVIYFPLPPKPMLRGTEYSEMAFGKHSAISSKFVIDPVILLKCIDTEKDPKDIISSTLLSREIESQIKGIKYEISKMEEPQKPNYEIMNTYNNLSQMENKLNFMKPKQKKQALNDIRKMQEELGKTNMEIIKIWKTYEKIMKKLQNQYQEGANYIDETLQWQIEVLKKTNYIHEKENKLYLTVSGKAATCINESDSFLVVEYLNNFMNRIENVDKVEDLTVYLSFILGSFVDEKECLKQEEDGIWRVEDMVKLAPIQYEKYIQEEIDTLKQTYNQLINEERLQNYDTNISPLFGAYVYLWVVEKRSYNELIHFTNCELYEGNFVKNMLKVHNLCEEWKSISQIYQKPILTKCLENIQATIIRDIVICDSLYIQKS
tara:strand:- start:324 stop:2663 length:2340 start_codon:yes stop_codon:yes gene_type:complete